MLDSRSAYARGGWRLRGCPYQREEDAEVFREMLLDQSNPGEDAHHCEDGSNSWAEDEHQGHFGGPRLVPASRVRRRRRVGSRHVDGWPGSRPDVFDLLRPEKTTMMSAGAGQVAVGYLSLLSCHSDIGSGVFVTGQGPSTLDTGPLPSRPSPGTLPRAQTSHVVCTN